MSAAAAGERPVALSMGHLTKTYPGTVALDDVSLELRSGEMHALIGENGAGKTTLMMLLSGVVAPDSGRIVVGLREVHFSSPLDAQRAGIGTVFQELSLVDSLSVAENIFVNRAPVGPLGLINRRGLERDATKLLELLGAVIDPGRRLGSAPLGVQQLVEIAKALSLHARILLLDEPTSALSKREATTLFSVIDNLKAQGIAIVFVSHRLAEVFDFADRITILRDGRLVGTYDSGEISVDRAVRLMVGRELSHDYPARSGAPGDVLLEAVGVVTSGVGPIDLAMRAGEIVSLAGLEGSGRSEFAQALAGARRIDAGRVSLAGRPCRYRAPWEALADGIAYVTSDRKQEGVYPRMSLMDNIVSTALGQTSVAGLVVESRRRRLASELVSRFRVKASSLDQQMRRLSGGNQQKALLARSLSVSPRVLIMDEPTQGIDVGAKADIHRLLRELADSGVAVLLVSSDLPEVLGMSDRIVVMAGGRVRAVLDGPTATEESVMDHAAGHGVAA